MVSSKSDDSDDETDRQSKIVNYDEISDEEEEEDGECQISSHVRVYTMKRDEKLVPQLLIPAGS